MKAKEKDSVTYTVQAMEKAANAPASLEDFLVRKLGNSAGKSLYKELQAAAKDATKSHVGLLAIDLETKRGSFVLLREAR